MTPQQRSRRLLRALHAYVLHTEGARLREIADRVGLLYDGKRPPDVAPQPITRERARQLVVEGRKLVQEMLVRRTLKGTL